MAADKNYRVEREMDDETGEAIGWVVVSGEGEIETYSHTKEEAERDMADFIENDKLEAAADLMTELESDIQEHIGTLSGDDAIAFVAKMRAAFLAARV